MEMKYPKQQRFLNGATQEAIVEDMMEAYESHEIF